MRKILIVICIFLVTAILALCGCTPAPKSQEVTDGNVLFFDDFDSLDTSVWNVYTQKTDSDSGWENADGVRKGGYWDKAQVFTRDGKLIIRTSLIDGKYYTGAIDTCNNFERTYGYYECRVFLPRATGIWAAYWLMSNKMGAKSTDAKISGSEIDIFESPYYTVGSGEEGTYQSAIHIGDYDKNYINTTWLSTLSSLTNKNLKINIYNDWHTFALDWQEDGYKFYYDDNLMWETDYNNNVSNQNGYLFLSVEIPGSNGVAGAGPFVLGSSIFSNSDSVFPTEVTADGEYDSDFLVDYVKVCKTKPQAD